MRLIDADELYRAKFHGVAEIFPPDEQNVESYKRGWNDALDAVADDSCAQTIDPHNWIPCSERLPEKENWYIVTLVGRITIVDLRLFCWGAWCDDRLLPLADQEQIVAWMEKPKAYRGGKENETD